MSGATVKTTLEGWARVQGWTVVWDDRSDYLVQGSAVLRGDFEQAVAQLFDIADDANPSLAFTLYQGNATLHVSSGSL
jgi:hypothetical protein